MSLLQLGISSVEAAHCSLNRNICDATPEWGRDARGNFNFVAMGTTWTIPA